MPPRQKIDFAHYESQYPRIFRLLREAGWNERRDVDFPDVDEDSDGQLRGNTVLHDRAYSFLRSFYGLNIIVRRPPGEARFLIGFGPQWELMQFEKHHDKVQRIASDIAGDGFSYPILTWDRCVAFLLWDSDQVFAIDDNYQICFQAKDPFQLMESSTSCWTSGSRVASAKQPNAFASKISTTTESKRPHGLECSTLAMSHDKVH